MYSTALYLSIFTLTHTYKRAEILDTVNITILLQQFVVFEFNSANIIF